MRRRTVLALAGLPLIGAERFTDQLWSASLPVYRATLAHPFLKGLADGTLARSRFQFYLQQDALYLRAFSQALNMLAAKAPREEWALTLSKHAIESIATERQFHDSVLKSYGAVAVTEMAPVNAAYTNHLMVSVTRESFGPGLAAMLPCYWIYWEVGKELKRRGSNNADYRKWIEQYSDPAYGASVDAVKAMMDAVEMTGEAREKARGLFMRSARYEWMFWDMAWREEKWPVG